MNHPPTDDDDVTRDPEHCEHCSGCRLVWLGAHASDDGTLWSDGHCPYCAMRKRIVDALRDAAPDEFPGIESQWVRELLAEAYDECEEIARNTV